MSKEPEDKRHLIHTAKAQIDRFKQTARELGCDETGEAFEKVFQKVVPSKVPDPRAGGDKDK